MMLGGMVRLRCDVEDIVHRMRHLQRLPVNDHGLLELSFVLLKFALVLEHGLQWDRIANMEWKVLEHGIPWDRIAKMEGKVGARDRRKH